MMGLTPKQAELLKVIKRDVHEKGYPPSYEEMARQVGLVSTSGVARLIEALEERGLIRRLPNRARAIEVIDETPLGRFTTEELLAETLRAPLGVVR